MKLTGLIKEVVEFVIMLGIMLIIVFGLRHFVFEPFKVEGHSMDYTLASEERIFMWKLAKIERFDVVVLKAPDSPDKRYIKRVIGLPGDTIEVKNNQLIINGVASDEPYLAEKVAEYAKTNPGQPFTRDFSLETLPNVGVSTIPEGKVFVMGDNRQNSLDGRSFGLIDQSLIEGEADVIFWPLNKVGLLTKYKLNDAGQIVTR